MVLVNAMLARGGVVAGEDDGEGEDVEDDAMTISHWKSNIQPVSKNLPQ